VSNASRGSASVTSLILGLDVSPRRLGWGLVSLIDGSPVDCGMEPIGLPDHGWQHQQVARALERVAARGKYDPSVPAGQWYQGAEIQAVYIEQPWLSPRSGTKSAYNAGRAVQAAQSEVERRWPWAPIEYLQPAEWKLLAGLKGNATKPQIMDQAWRVLSLDRGDFMAGVVVEQDAADALLIAVAGWHRNEDTMEQAAALSRRGS
jgi:Holliday junction resolvasome RuvABC endonuclease subunit